MNTSQKLTLSSLYHQYRMSGKIAVIGLIALLLMIPAAMVKSTMRDRQNYSDTAKRAIHNMWSEKQTVIGPILEVPYTVPFKNSNNTYVAKTYYFYIVPDTLDAHADLAPELRKRGIFETVLYTAHLQMQGAFSPKSHIPKRVNPTSIQWQKAQLIVNVSDTRGIQLVALKQGNEKRLFKVHDRVSGSRLGQAMACDFPINDESLYAFDIDLRIKGSEDFNIVPVAERSKIQIASTWDSPSFSGKFLPDTRQVDQEGFSAVWEVTGLSRGFPQSWVGNNTELQESFLGTRLMMPVSAYTRCLRLVSYALLFVAFTFGAMFCAERMSGVAIHALQYLVAGFAMIVFYLLLLSIAEQLAFLIAYMIAATVIVSMLVLYVNAILKRRKLRYTLASMLVVMYSYFYLILLSEKYALLMGSTGLVVIIATVMYFTRDLHKIKQ